MSLYSLEMGDLLGIADTVSNMVPEYQTKQSLVNNIKWDKCYKYLNQSLKKIFAQIYYAGSFDMRLSYE